MVDPIKNPLVLRVIRVFALPDRSRSIGAGFAAEAWDLMRTSGRLRRRPSRLPMSWFYALPFLGFVSTAVRAARAVLHRRARRPRGAAPTVVAAE